MLIFTPCVSTEFNSFGFSWICSHQLISELCWWFPFGNHLSCFALWFLTVTKLNELWICWWFSEIVVLFLPLLRLLSCTLNLVRRNWPSITQGPKFRNSYLVFASTLLWGSGQCLYHAINFAKQWVTPHNLDAAFCIVAVRSRETIGDLAKIPCSPQQVDESPQTPAHIYLLRHCMCISMWPL